MSTKQGETVSQQDAHQVEKGSSLIHALHLATLCSLSFAQPILDLLAKHPELFVIRRIDRSSLFFLVFVLLFGPPLVTIFIEFLCRLLGSRVRCWIHPLLVGLVCTPLGVLIFKRFAGLPDAVIVAAGLCAAAAFGFFYHRIAAVRTFVTVMGLMLIAVPLTFVFSPGIAKILWQDDVAGLELGSIDSRAPVIMVVLDELPASLLVDGNGHVNQYRFPNLAELAGQSFWFRSATAGSEITETAVPAILTGRFPETGGLPALSDHPQNLFTLFGGNYDLWAEEPVTSLCPPELNLKRDSSSRGLRLWALLNDLKVVYLHVLLPAGMTSGLPQIDHTWSGFSVAGDHSVPQNTSVKPKNVFRKTVEALGVDRRQSFSDLFSAIDQASGRRLFFLHSLLPHRPVEFAAPWYQYSPGTPGLPGLTGLEWGNDEYLIDQAYQRFILQATFLDHAIGRLVERLRENELFDRSLIVLTADHGASYRPGTNYRLVSDSNSAEIVPVPLLIKAPNQENGQVLDTWVRSIDVLPTMLDLLGTSSPWPMDGISAFAEKRSLQGPIQVLTKKSGVFSCDQSIFQKMREWAEQQNERFGSGSDPLDLYRIGPSPSLVGQELSNLLHGESSAAKVRVNQQWEFDSFDPNSMVAPLHVGGDVLLDRPDSIEGSLAIAINGVVCATTYSRGAGKVRSFSAMLPLQCLRPGQNEVDLFVIETGDGQPLLHRLMRDQPIERFQRASLLDPADEHVWVIPAAASVAGAGGAKWRTDLVLHNPNQEEATATLTFLGRDSKVSREKRTRIELSPSTSTRLVDVVGGTLDRKGKAGAIVVGADLPLLVTSRTYRQVGPGSCAQLVPAIPLEKITSGRRKVRLAHLTGPGQFKTHIGFVNLDAEPLRLSLTLKDNKGKDLETRMVDVAGFSTRQINRVVSDDSLTVKDLTAVIRASSGRASYIAYASVVDRGSGDSIFVFPLEAAAEAIYIPTAVHFPDQTNGTWRTEAKVLNNARRPARFKVTLLPGGSAGSVVSKELTLGPGRLGSNDDVLKNLLKVSGSAALRFDVLAGELMVSSRTYLTTDQGTRGQLVPGLSSANVLRRGEEARLIGLGPSGDRHSGVHIAFGLCSASDREIEVSVDLYAGDGTTLGRRMFDLPPHQSFHDSDLFYSVATESGSNAFAVIKSETPGARYIAFASVVDDSTHDLLYVPAQPSLRGR